MKILYKIIVAILPIHKYKLKFEYLYWYTKYLIFRKFSNEHYKYLFTNLFGLDYEFYNQKVILDLGCGPRGSLEWANNTKERIGLDPLVAKYKKFNIQDHKTKYIIGIAENIPFKDEYFDIVSSFNSFDHFDNIYKSINEINKVLKTNGLFLLITSVHQYPKVCEPSAFIFQIKERFNTKFELLNWREIRGNRMYKSIRKNRLCKMNSNKGIIVAMMKKKK